ncbi:SIR2 family NAD-dependent protein deacylase [Motilibacter aurantiacus]|uniref:SIR2 family NAD-dependent protein deacylase n=1 Tax=Motilibacter aurantiacus TaxID=2714955 RepID=UPI00140DEA61|nr:Sir2 family NAD-dependent protein deacetylase [Motilibacter aurantiacus]NHC45416.1 NAD-dependent deacetylase [Motilibacter aurantiacus]
MEAQDGIEDAAGLVAAAGRIAVLTGAGISTESGIPDFRGPNGIWTRDPSAVRMLDIDEYVADPELRRRAWALRRDNAGWAAQPNAGHLALVELERQGRLVSLATQNIDGLHQRAGSSPGLVLELHGTMWEAECLSCHRHVPMAEVLARVEAGEEDPACLVCGGVLKSATVSFGQSLDEQVLARAFAAARSCDLFLAIGTTLQVLPAASLPGAAQAAGAALVVVNQGETAYDDTADAIVHAPIGQALPALVMPAANAEG